MKSRISKRTERPLYRLSTPFNSEVVSAARILIVDSDPAIRGLVSNSLRHLGHYVAEVESPAAALQVTAEGQTFDLLVTDVDSQAAGGIAMARKLLDKGAISAILFMTESLPLTRALTRSIGSGMFITKPFTAEDFKRRVDEGLRRARRDKDFGNCGNVWAKQRLSGIGSRPTRGLWRNSDRTFTGYEPSNERSPSIN